MQKIFLKIGIVLGIIFIMPVETWSQNAKIDGYFIGENYISTNADAVFVFTNKSDNPDNITSTQWIVIDSLGTEIVNATVTNMMPPSQYQENVFYYYMVFSQPGIYKGIINVSWGVLTKSDSMKITIEKQNISLSCLDTLTPKGSISYRISGNDCRPVEVYFKPAFNSKGDMPDSIFVISGSGEMKTNRGDSSRMVLEMRQIYQIPGAYLPTYLMSRTLVIGGVKETCIVQIKETDSIYVVEIMSDFDTEPLYYPNEPVTFNNTSTWTPNYLQYDSISWNLGNGNITEDYDPTTVYDSTGTYSVNLKIKVLNCVNSKYKNIEVVDKVGVVNMTKDNSYISIYPNPTTGQLQITSSELQLENLECTINSILGHVVKRFTIQNAEYKVNIDISDLPAGVYYLRIADKIAKIIKI